MSFLHVDLKRIGALRRKPHSHREKSDFQIIWGAGLDTRSLSTPGKLSFRLKLFIHSAILDVQLYCSAESASLSSIVFYITGIHI